MQLAPHTMFPSALLHNYRYHPFVRRHSQLPLSAVSPSLLSYIRFQCLGQSFSTSASIPHPVLPIRWTRNTRTCFSSQNRWLSSKLDTSNYQCYRDLRNFRDQKSPCHSTKEQVTYSEKQIESSADTNSTNQFSSAFDILSSPLSHEDTEEYLKSTDDCGGNPDRSNIRIKRIRPKRLKRSKVLSSRNSKQAEGNVQAILESTPMSNGQNFANEASGQTLSQKPDVQQVKTGNREAIEESKRTWEFLIKSLNADQLSTDIMDYEGLKRFSKKNNLKLDDAFFGHFESTSSLLFPSSATTIYSVHSNISDDYDLSKNPRKKPSFKDCIQICVRGGAGGRGASTFYRDNRVSRGPPDGGDGGDGGDVVLVASRHLKPSLASILPVYRAGSGGAGGKNKKTGKKGNSVYIHVPLGISISEVIRKPRISEKEGDHENSTKKVPQILSSEVQSLPSNKEASQDDEVNMDCSEHLKDASPCLDTVSQVFSEEVISSIEEDSGSPSVEIDVTRSPRLAELNSDGDFFVAAQGGRGGLGNARLTSARHRSQKTFTNGSQGEVLNYKLELKLIADVGLIGYPNAGKSTLLAALSRAKPKIASYPFTTLTPEIGTVQFDDYSQLSIADLPGLAPHLNRGLGREFLRHAERTCILCFVIDLSQRDDQSPYQVFETLWDELEKYGGGLMGKAKLIVANKIDKIQVVDKWGKAIETTFSAIQTFSERMKKRREFKKLKIYPVSAQQGTNLQALAYALKYMLQTKSEIQDERKRFRT